MGILCSSCWDFAHIFFIISVQKVSTTITPTHSFYRGIHSFQLLASDDLNVNYFFWTPIMSGTLESASGLGCDAPVQTFYLDQPIHQRYVIVFVDAFHGTAGGLQYIETGTGGRCLILLAKCTVLNMTTFLQSCIVRIKKIQ